VQIWRAVLDAPGSESYLRQLAWREFACHLLVEHPHTITQPFTPLFKHFPWRSNARWLKAWQQGRTGYPMVDAAMRQLWTTGWMHNRARLIVASFLVKHLLIPWQDGAAWFLDTLVDADLANNTMGWQWVAGCGVDATPYFRVFNPILQGEKFDPEGEYVRQWVPELSALPADWIHRPWTAPPLALAAANVNLGDTYPLPLVDHAEARSAALHAFEEMKSASRSR
jgi:deoxyribodipyrimidine photo-lyase